MSHPSGSVPAAMRAGGTLLLLGLDGHVVASDKSGARGTGSHLPFGLQREVHDALSHTREQLMTTDAEVLIDYWISIRIFPLQHNRDRVLALYLEPAWRRTD